VLNEAISLLEKIKELGLFAALEDGLFADVKRSRKGGKGLEGVLIKGKNYINPYIDLMKGRK